MAIKQKTIIVNGSEYLITQMGALKGTRVLKELTKLAGPSFTKLQDKGTVADALNALFEQLDKANVEGIMNELIATVTKGNGTSFNFDMEFAGEYDKLFTVLKEVVEFNFGSVFTLLGSNG